MAMSGAAVVTTQNTPTVREYVLMRKKLKINNLRERKHFIVKVHVISSKMMKKRMIWPSHCHTSLP